MAAGMAKARVWDGVSFLLLDKMRRSKPPLRQEISDGRDEPLAPADDRGLQLVAGDATILITSKSRDSVSISVARRIGWG
jgi:hypothetical protein